MSRWLLRLRLLLRALFRPGRIERDLDEELRFHLEREIDERLKEGLAPEIARTSARLAMGNMTRSKDAWRDVALRPNLKGAANLFFQDAKFGARLFRRHAAPVAIAIGGLALAIAVVTSIFTVVDATMFRPYGMDDPASVVTAVPAGRASWGGWAYAQWLKMRGAATLTGVEASLVEQVRVGIAPDRNQEHRRYILFVSGGYLPLLGGRPSLGRSLGPADDRPGAEPVAVVSRHFWQTEFAGDPASVGRRLWINGSAVTIVGVLEPGFTGPENTRPPIWVPLAAMCDVGLGPASGPNSDRLVKVVARLSPAVSPFVAAQSLTAVLRPSGPAQGQTPRERPQEVMVYRSGRPMDGPASQDDWVAIAIVGGIGLLILALACANTANLLLAASMTRVREVGVRLALGASRARLFQQMLNESVLLGSIAGGAGFLLTYWAAPLLGQFVQVSPGLDLAPNLTVLAFAIVVAPGCGIGAGLTPARHGARGQVSSALQGGGGARFTGGGTRLRGSFIGFQAAASTLLLVIAALLTRTAIVMTTIDPGFDADHVVVVSPLPLHSGVEAWTYINAAMEALHLEPTVRGVSVTAFEPFGPSRWNDRFTQAGRSYELRGSFTDADFFSTAGVRVLPGRAFTKEEADREAPVALVSESVARAFFAAENPVGQSLARVPASGNRRQPPDTIIGTVADAMMDGPESEVFGAIYRPIHRKLQQAFTDQGFLIPPSLLVRVTDTGGASRAIEEALLQIDSRVRPEVTPLRERLDQYLGAKRTFAWLVGPIAALSLLLAALGMYGVTSFATAQRTHEVSVRLAVGASRGDVLRLLIKQSLRPVVVGLGCGLFLAIVASELLARQIMLSGISAHDPASVVLALSTILAFALVAVIVPARRAARVDPATLLRQS